ncbi:MAG: Arc family DNA-binding protein [Planctomycetota bacterium]
MSGRKPFLLRISAELIEELRAWAAQEMRSLNGQIEYLLAEAVKRRRRQALDEKSSEDKKDLPER